MKKRTLLAGWLVAAAFAPSALSQATFEYSAGFNASLEYHAKYWAVLPGDGGVIPIDRYIPVPLAQPQGPSSFSLIYEELNTPIPEGAQGTGGSGGQPGALQGWWADEVFAEFDGVFSGNASTISLDFEKHVSHEHAAALTVGPEPLGSGLRLITREDYSWPLDVIGKVHTVPFSTTSSGTVTLDTFQISRLEWQTAFTQAPDGRSSAEWRVDVDSDFDGLWDGASSTPVASGSLSVIGSNSAGSPASSFNLPPGNYTLRVVALSWSQIFTIVPTPPNTAFAMLRRAWIDNEVDFQISIQ